MSLRITNKATAKQIQVLKEMDYVGKWDLTIDEATEIIGELFEERREALKNEDYDKEEQWG